jgi:hypothetical protein
MERRGHLPDSCQRPWRGRPMIHPFICFVGGPLQGPSVFALSYHGLHPWLLMVCPFGAIFQMALFAYVVSLVLRISASRATQGDTHRCRASRLWLRTSLGKGECAAKIAHMRSYSPSRGCQPYRWLRSFSSATTAEWLAEAAHMRAVFPSISAASTCAPQSRSSLITWR